MTVPCQVPEVMVPTVANEARLVTALVTSPPAVLTALPIAVTTPAPVAMLEGAAPAPPPTTIALAPSKPDELSAVVELKYGMPPEVVVPATVCGNVLVKVWTWVAVHLRSAALCTQ